MIVNSNIQTIKPCNRAIIDRRWTVNFSAEPTIPLKEQLNWVGTSWVKLVGSELNSVCV